MRFARTAAVALWLLAATSPAFADAWHAARTLMPGDTVQDDDVVAGELRRPVPEALPSSKPVVGLEVKRRIYQGRVLTEHDVGPRSAVKANTPVDVIFKQGGLSLDLEARALESGGLGDEIRVLNPATSRTIRGIVVGDGMIEIRSNQ